MIPYSVGLLEAVKLTVEIAFGDAARKAVQSGSRASEGVAGVETERSDKVPTCGCVRGPARLESSM